MATAGNPYSSYNRLKKTPKSTGSRWSSGKGYASPLKKKKKPVVAAPTAPAAPSAPAVPPPPTGPPETLSGASTRVSGRESYGLGMADINRKLMEAALRFGGAPNVLQFGLGSQGEDTQSSLDVTRNPGDSSVMSTITRDLGTRNRLINEGANANNTFFSSRREGDIRASEDDSARARADALAAYQSAIADLTSQLLGMRSSRDEALRGATISDIQAAEATPPPEATPQEAAPTASKPKAGFKFVQSTGSRAGLSYNLLKKGNKWYRVYENGDKVLRP